MSDLSLEQLAEFVAEALYDGYRADENMRRAEIRALHRPLANSPRRAMLGPPYDLPGWLAGGTERRDVFRRRAQVVVRALEKNGLLVAGPGRRYDVEIDDPDMRSKHAYSGVAAVSAWAAAWEGARRAVLDDPTHGIPPGARVPTTKRFPFPGEASPYDAVAWENPDLIEAVAMWARVRPSASGGGDVEWLEGDVLWDGY